MYPMRRFTPSGSRVTSMPPTIAVPDVGFNSPHSILIVVDLPAPLLPRKPKISPRATSNVTLSTATKSPNRLVRPRTSMALLSNRALQSCFREPDVRDCAGPIELGLQPSDLRVEDVGRRRHARLIAFTDDALRFERGTHLVICGCDRLLARLEFQGAGTDFERHLTIEVLDARPECSGVRASLAGFG